jgi:hypothetical protein
MTSVFWQLVDDFLRKINMVLLYKIQKNEFKTIVKHSISVKRPSKKYLIEIYLLDGHG